MPDIKEWVREQLKAGYSKEAIRQSLLKGGYNPKLLDEVLTETLIKQETNVKLMAKSSNTVIFLVAIVSLLAGILISFYYFSNVGASVLKYEDILNKNPKLSVYTKGELCREKLGLIYGSLAASGAGKSRLNVLTFNGEVIGILFVWPAGEGWFSHADQREGSPIDTGGVSSYTQTIYFKDPPTAEDCAIATG